MKYNKVHETILDSQHYRPEMALAAHGTGVVTSVALVHIVSAGAGGVKAVDDVGDVNVGEPLGGHDLETDSPGAAEMVLKVPLPSLTDVNVGDLVSAAI